MGDPQQGRVTIIRAGIAYESAQCGWCGGHISPSSALPAHMRRHRRIKRYMVKKVLSELRRTLKASRL